jgi:dienelactone hydrolase
MSCSEKSNNNSAEYSAGFRIIKAVDKARVYKPQSDSTDILHYRPLDLDIWYPARKKENDTVLHFRQILSLLEKRALYYTGSDQYKGITSQIAQSFCDGFNCSDSTRLLNFKTRSYKDATPLEEKFPLIVYLCAYNGMSYENFDLFERLAENGFVVVSISSIGRFPGDMTMKQEDLMEQVSDAFFSLTTIRDFTNIDFSRVGIVGYSWGGLAAALLEGKVQNVKCIVSLDGSEFHHYGEAREENTDFNNIRNSREFKKIRIDVPYLRLESTALSPGEKPEKVDSVYNFAEKVSGKISVVKIDSAQHADFSCLSEDVRDSGGCKSDKHFRKALNIILPFLEEHLKMIN